MDAHPPEIEETLEYLHGLIGQRVLATLRYGDYVLARFPMVLEDGDVEDEVLTLVGDVRDTGDALVYSEVSLPLPQGGGLQLAVAVGEMRLSTEDGLTLEVIALGQTFN